MNGIGAFLNILWIVFDLLTQNPPCAAPQCWGFVGGDLWDLLEYAKVSVNDYLYHCMVLSWEIHRGNSCSSCIITDLDPYLHPFSFLLFFLLWWVNTMRGCSSAKFGGIWARSWIAEEHFTFLEEESCILRICRSIQHGIRARYLGQKARVNTFRMVYVP